jgi:hypothetical protein
MKELKEIQKMAANMPEDEPPQNEEENVEV